MASSSSYIIEPERRTLHGQFNQDLPPVLIIDSGESILYRTLDVSWGMGQHPLSGTYRPKFEPREGERDAGPALCGPVAIRGAEPGMVLEILFEEIQPVDWGWTYTGDTGFNTNLLTKLGLAETPGRIVRWTLDMAQKTGVSELGYQVSLNPFLGTIGMPLAKAGWQNGWHPKRTGGNIDCKELTVGSCLYLPIEVPGGLVSVGDGHARQGDGEVAGSAIECCMERVQVRYTLHPPTPITQPYANTATGWLTFGFNKDLEEATVIALNSMLQLLNWQYGLNKQDALAIASAVVDLHITQMVNGVKGVHAILPHTTLTQTISP